MALLARSAEGSMRDAESAFDQVIAFAGRRMTTDDVATVLGLVGRDLLFDIVTAVADEDAAPAFALAGRAVEAGYDLRIVCRELAALVRAMMLVIDRSVARWPIRRWRSRASANGSWRWPRGSRARTCCERSTCWRRPSRTCAPASQPRYALEMVLLRWIHLRKLVPIEDVIAGLERARGSSLRRRHGRGGCAGAAGARSGGFARAAGVRREPGVARSGARPQARSARPRAQRAARRRPSRPAQRRHAGQAAPDAVTQAALASDFRDRFLAELKRKPHVLFDGRRAGPDELNGRAAPGLHVRSGARDMRQQVEQRRAWLEELAESVGGRRVAVTTVRARQSRPRSRERGSKAAAPRRTRCIRPAADAASRTADLRARALADDDVQAMLEIFPAEIREVEEIK